MHRHSSSDKNKKQICQKSNHINISLKLDKRRKGKQVFKKVQKVALSVNQGVWERVERGAGEEKICVCTAEVR